MIMLVLLSIKCDSHRSLISDLIGQFSKDKKDKGKNNSRPPTPKIETDEIKSEEVTTEDGKPATPAEEATKEENTSSEPVEKSEENKSDKKEQSEKQSAEKESSTDDSNKKDKSDKDEEENLIEIEDPDDYLLYLEHILMKIHETFYEEYEKTKQVTVVRVNSKTLSTNDSTLFSFQISDLKRLIPQVKSQVLVGFNLVFSGLVPNSMKLVESKAYQVARSLGAKVTQDFTPETTHLVAVTFGTSKVHNARKNPKIKMVTPEWLWACAERWEHVEERLYPLKQSKPSKMRQPPPHCHSPGEYWSLIRSCVFVRHRGCSTICWEMVGPTSGLVTLLSYR